MIMGPQLGLMGTIEMKYVARFDFVFLVKDTTNPKNRSKSIFCWIFRWKYVNDVRYELWAEVI